MHATDEKTALQYALRLLARREYSQAELFQRLQRKGLCIEAAKTILTHLQDKGWQSEMRFVQQFVQHNIDKGYGPKYITLALLARGVSHQLIEKHLPRDEEFWFLQLKKVQRKHFSDALPEGADAFSKQFRFLLRRGFDKRLTILLLQGEEINS